MLHTITTTTPECVKSVNDFTPGFMNVLPCILLQVRSYHRSYYRPDNLCLIVTGQVEAEQLFKALAPFEEKILSKVVRPPLFVGIPSSMM